MADSPSIEELEEALRQAPGNAPARYLLGATLASAGEYERAAGEMEVALKLEPALHTARLQLGLLYLMMGRPQLALESWEPLEQLPPTSALPLFKRGVEALIRDDFAQCVSWLTQGIAANQDNEPLNRDMQLLIDKAREACSGGAGGPGSVRTDFSLYNQ